MLSLRIRPSLSDAQTVPKPDHLGPFGAAQLVFYVLLQVCETYPAKLYVPVGVSDITLLGSSRFRSRGRFPVLSYLHVNNGVRTCRMFYSLESSFRIEAVRVRNQLGSHLVNGQREGSSWSH